MMKEQLQPFLNEQFAQYGDFPAREDVIQELRVNMEEKFDDLKSQGKNDDEAYRITVDSLGDVNEIMEHVPHRETRAIEQVARTAATLNEQPQKRGFWSKLKGGRKEKGHALGRFKATDLREEDLSDADLGGFDFSASALTDTRYDGSNLKGAKFKAAALEKASFVKADLSRATFASSNLHDACFDGANLTGTSFKASGVQGATFVGATLRDVKFKTTDLSGLSFDNQVLDGVTFDTSSLKGTSFRNATLRDVSFHYSAVRDAIFDGAFMDRVTHVTLKTAGASVKNVTIV